LAVRVRPISKNAKYARVDQGVDYEQSENYVSVGSGTVIRIAPHSFAGGTGDSVYIRLDKPIKVNGRTYNEVYYAEQTPLVSLGQKVKAGQPVMKGGGAELGFADNGHPVAPLQGGLGAGTQDTQAGHDFLAFVNGKGTQSNTVSHSAPSDTQTGTDSIPTVLPPQAIPAPSDSFIGSSQGVQMPGSVSYTIDPAHVTSLWQQAATSDFVSPETQAMLQNAQLAAGS
jgi:hypothetical protein